MCVEGGEPTSVLEIRDICQFYKRYLIEVPKQFFKGFWRATDWKVYVFNWARARVCVCAYTHTHTCWRETQELSGYCFCRGSEFGFLHPCWVAQHYLTRGYSSLSGLDDTCAHVCIPTPTFEHINTIKNDKNLKKLVHVLSTFSISVLQMDSL